MNLYADSSFIVASRMRHDTFHRVALQFYNGHEADIWFWSPWHLVEVLNTIRQLTRNSDRKRSISQAEAKAVILVSFLRTSGGFGH
jgi:predicted nucleic acid-binding protein